MKNLLLFTLLFISFNLSAQTNNYSLEFDGTDDDVTGAASSALDVSNTNNLTISAWVKPNDFNGPQRVFHHSSASGSNQQYSLNINAGNIYFLSGQSSFEQNGQNISTVLLNLGVWNHISMTYDGSAVRLYLNGIIVFENFVVDNFPTNWMGYFYMGKRSDGAERLNGSIDDVHVWNVALDSNQIQQYMNCPPTGNETGLVGYWNIEEGTGTNTADQTTNGNDGTINGATWSTDIPPHNCCTPNPITSQPTDQTVNIGNNATISFSDTLTGASYQWQMDAGTSYSDLSNAGQFSGTDTKTLTITSTTMSNNNTLYRCIVTESASCMDTTDVSTLTVIDNASISELNNSLVKLFPNPSNDIITLTLAHPSNGQIILTDILGKEVLNKSFTSNEIQLNLKSLEYKGTYFVKVLDLEGNVIAIKKLIYQ